VSQSLAGHLRPSLTRKTTVDVALKNGSEEFGHAVVSFGPRAASGIPTLITQLDTAYGGHWFDFDSGSFLNPASSRLLALKSTMEAVPSGSHCWILLSYDDVGDGTAVAAHVGPFDAP